MIVCVEDAFILMMWWCDQRAIFAINLPSVLHTRQKCTTSSTKRSEEGPQYSNEVVPAVCWITRDSGGAYLDTVANASC
jgi:hypothetical protein